MLYMRSFTLHELSFELDLIVTCMQYHWTIHTWNNICGTFDRERHDRAASTASMEIFFINAISSFRSCVSRSNLPHKWSNVLWPTDKWSMYLYVPERERRPFLILIIFKFEHDIFRSNITFDQICSRSYFIRSGVKKAVDLIRSRISRSKKFCRENGPEQRYNAEHCEKTTF